MSADSVITFGQLASLDGITFCVDGKVHRYMSLDLDSTMRQDVEAHETKHKEQYGRFKTCAAFDAYYKTPVGMLASEAEAYASGWCVAKHLGADADELRARYIQNLYRKMGGGTAIYDILLIWKVYEAKCP